MRYIPLSGMLAVAWLLPVAVAAAGEEIVPIPHGALAGERCRVIASSDIGGSDPDDHQSMIHLLVYADVMDIEGLVSSPPGNGRASHIQEVIDAYEADYPQLVRSANGYPAPDALRAVVKQGATGSAPEAGFSAATEGSRWIVERARAADPRPLYVLVWGSITDVAQAVHDAPDIKAKLRVYSIGSWNTGQDRAARNYLYHHHEDLWWIESDTTFRGMYVGGNQEGDLGNKAFLDAHVRGHGALGGLLVEKLAAIKMGDSPSVLYMLAGDPADPTLEHWGGRYVATDHGPHFWTDDPNPELAEKSYAGAKTVSRWREAWLRDWQARMDRLVTAGAAAEAEKPVVKNGPMPGQIIPAPDHPAWLVRNADENGDGRLDPFFMCGPGDPEDFLYRGQRRPDGAREGDQERIIARLEGTGANCLYLQAVRSHGGDGDATHNPFVDSDPAQGLDEDILQQWEGWFSCMDDAGIVIYLFIYDDNTLVWDTGDELGTQEQAFLETLVNRFEHHENLIWCLAEEYQERLSPARARAMAQAIREADDHDHVIAVHKLNGLDFDEFADDPCIGQFAIQYNEPTADALHVGVVEAWRMAQGRYSLNLSEAAGYGFGAKSRRKHWAAALGGAHAMAIDWTFKDDATPSDEDLKACGYLVRFMESTDFNEMAPHDELAAGGTAYLLAKPGDSYIAYAPDVSRKIGIRAVTADDYDLTWCDPATGKTVDSGPLTLPGGDCSLTAPADMQGEAAVWIRRSQASKTGHSKDLGRRDATMWSPYLEWAIKNPSYTVNPFDVVAEVRFSNDASAMVRTTEMFFAGDDTWRFRFTGDKAGVWTFTTSSPDPDLDGFSGSVTVRPNPDKNVTGFLTHAGNKFALQHADADDLRGYLFNVYMNGHIHDKNFTRLADPALLDALLDDTQANGFDTAFTFVCNNWLKLGALGYDEHDSVNPDLATFDILDRIITRAHARGMRWHFWAWGDESRKWTARGLPGGINGEVDRRLQRYIAARLGPLAGWTMGYGFDLIEWTDEEVRNGWADYLHGKMGWDHLLCTRGFPLRGTRNNITSYSGFGGPDLTTTRGGPADYSEVVRHIDADPLRPSFYEERHSYLREGFKLDMDGTRRLRWWQAMAGGVGGFYGFYAKSSHPYPNPEQLRTFQRFWTGRFSLDMQRANEKTSGYALMTPDMARMVIYKEDADAIDVDLSGMPRSAPAVAVDARKEYAEIDLGLLEARQQTVLLPYASDWAIAVGAFEPEPVRHASIRNGWLVHGGKAVLGWVQHNGWWRSGQRPNLARRSVGDPKGDVRPNRTEDLDALTDNMLKYAYPGFEHNYGLWFDRRRDAHDTDRRDDADVQPPFLEQPWARGSTGTAWDGLPKYDLETFNEWYFERLKGFADLCDAKGAFLIHKHHMQHALLEADTHYVDFPWRSTNCIQDTGMPDTIPAASAFYDISHPERRRLHRLYIRKCLDELGDNKNVIHLPAQEFTGPLTYARFWIETVAEWEAETGKNVNLGMGATKDVLDALLQDSGIEPIIDTIDLRYWWHKTDGSLYAPLGGTDFPGRDLERGSLQSKETTPELVYRKVRAYRERYPDKAIMDALRADRVASWAFFMAGGSLLVRDGIQYADGGDPDTYEAPVGVDEFLPSYEFLHGDVAKLIPEMHPIDLIQEGEPPVWALLAPGQLLLAYLPRGGAAEFQAGAEAGRCRARWLDPRSGEVLDAVPDDTCEDGRIRCVAPDVQDWVLILDWRG